MKRIEARIIALDVLQNLIQTHIENNMTFVDEDSSKIVKEIEYFLNQLIHKSTRSKKSKLFGIKSDKN